MLNGIVNVYKEKGYTSFDVVAKLRGILKMRKIGHTGTLDPEAEGVLLVCTGRATKVCGLLTDRDKEYETVLLLGVTTDTQDLSGTVLSRREVSVTAEEVEAVIGDLRENTCRSRRCIPRSKSEGKSSVIWRGPASRWSGRRGR